MTTPDEEKTLAEHDERLVRMMEQAHASSLLQMEAIKLRVAHQERLVVLCIGTLALSFTAATAFHITHAQKLAALPGLLRAWQLLLLAIVLSVVSNWLTVNGVTHLGNFLFRKQIGVRFSLLEPSLIKLAPTYARTEREAWNRYSTKYAHAEKYSDIFLRIAAGVGFLAQIGAFCAFVSLYFFAKAVLAA